MKKAAIFLNQCLPRSEIFVRHQVEGFKEYNPKLIACRAVTPSVAGDLEQVILNKNNTLPEKLKELKFKLTLRNQKLEEAVKDCALIHAHFGPTGWLASGIAVRTKKPLLVTLHGFDVLKDKISIRSDGILQKIYALNRKTLGVRVTKFICVSEYIKKRAIQFGLPAEKCVVHYMGIPLTPHITAKHVRQNEKDPIRLLAVGRLVPFKAHMKLIEAVAEVARRGHNVELNIIGDGPLSDVLEQQASGALKKYKFWSSQPHDKVLSLMRQSDIFCHTSMHMPNGQTEAFGLVVLEAQWAGLPVVAFKSGGVPEGISADKTGFLVPEGDTDAFADRICQLVTDQTLLNRMSKEAPEFVRENFDNQKQGRALEAIYNSVI